MTHSPAETRPARPPRIVTVIREPSEDMSPAVDWSSWYLTDEEDMGESPEQFDIIRVLVSVLNELGSERSWGDSMYVGGDAFFAWMPDEPLVRVSPDVYLLEDPPPPPLPSSWQTWIPGHRPPLLAIEVVSQNWRKDYVVGPEKYAELGARELVIFDPRMATAQAHGQERVPLQVFHRTDEGLLVQTYKGTGPAYLRTLDLYVVVVDTPRGPRLRLARDAQGRDFIPTTEEAKAAAEAERDVERSRREAAERELAEFRRRFGGLPD